MKRSISNKLLLLLIIAFSFSCKAKKDLTKVAAGKTVTDKALSKDALLKSVRNRQLDFSTLQMKARANFSINKKGNDASMNIRIRKDEGIWVSVTVIAGLEVARALITPDSIKVMNKVENTYLAKPFNYIHKYASKQITFESLQSLLVGNTIPDLISEESDIELRDRGLVLSGILRGLGYEINYDGNTKVVQANLADQKLNQSLTAAYSDFYVVSDRIMPHSVDIRSIVNKINVHLQLAYSQVTVNESVDFPFSVPKRLSVIN